MAKTNTVYVKYSGRWTPERATPLSWNMSEVYRKNILNVMTYINNYKTSNEGSYAICQFNDVHGYAATPASVSSPYIGFKGNEPNFIDYSGGNSVFDLMLFNGDISTVATVEEYNASLPYMISATSMNRLFVMGNHEYGWYKDGTHSGEAFEVTYPEVYFKSVINVPVTYSGLQYQGPSGDEDNGYDAIIYYYDDEKNNVRYIVLNYYYLTRRVNDENYPNESCHKLDTAQLVWLGQTLASAGTKDIIIAGHCNLNPFNLVPSGTQTSTPDNGLDGQTNLVNMIKAFKSRNSSYSAGGSTFNFSNTTGNFIMYTSGHYHALGYVNGTNGFNAFTGPSVNRPVGTDKKYAILMYIIDPSSNKIKLIQCRRDATYEVYDYTY